MPTHTDIQTLAQEFIKTSFSLPVELHRAARIYALNEGIATQDLYVSAIREYLKAASKKKTA